VGFNLKFKVIVNTRLKALTSLIWKLPKFTYVRVRSVVNGRTDKGTTRYLDLAEFDHVFRVLFNILPLLKAEKIAELQVNLADSTDLGEGLCAICMERQSDIVLSCMVSPKQHNFCSTCIDNWSVKDKSCPMCRMSIQVSQGFLMLNSGQIDIDDCIKSGIVEVTGVIGGSRTSI
jgi:hypothetical protein